MGYYIFRDKKFEIKEEDKDKYIVVACAKQENDYIIEWIEHYFKLGFDKIFIADNNDINDNSLEDILKDYINEGKVELFDLKGYQIIQHDYYNMFSQRGYYKWCAYFDCDEFLELNAYNNIKIFINENHPNDNFISFNWVNYGNNNELNKTNLKVQEKYKHPLPLICTENIAKKTILNGNYKCHYNTHGPSNEPLVCEKITDYKEGYIKHYKYKSLEEQAERKNRGDAYFMKWKETYKDQSFKLFNEIEYFSLMKKIFNMRGFWVNNEYVEQEIIIFNFNTRGLASAFNQMINAMLHMDNKYFVINDMDKVMPEYWFNILFEYALHTNNKVSFKIPSLTYPTNYIHINFGV